MVLTCSLCKKNFNCLNVVGNKSFCGDCLTNIHKYIYSNIPPDKIKNISYLEQQKLIEIYIISHSLGMRCNFQHEIKETEYGCKWYRSLCNNGEEDEFNCRYGYDDGDGCEHTRCKYHYINTYTKYILDFAIFYDKYKIDLELDGVAFHQDTEKDNIRNEYMQNRNWFVLRFDYQTAMKSNLIYIELKRLKDDIDKTINHNI